MKIWDNHPRILGLDFDFENTESSTAVNEIAQKILLIAKEDSLVSLFGMGTIGKKLSDKLVEEGKTVRHYFKYHEKHDEIRRPQEEIGSETSSEFCIICSPPTDYLTIDPLLHRLSKRFVFPFKSSFLDQYNKQPPPILLHLYPFAGTGRFFPVFQDILKKHFNVYVQTDYTVPILSNANYTSSFSDSDAVHSRKGEIDEKAKRLLSQSMDEMNPGECYFHHAPPIHFSELPKENLKTIYLMRDPRDTFVSCLNRHIFNASDSKGDDGFESLDGESALLRLLECGLYRKGVKFCTVFPPLEEFISSYLSAVAHESENFAVVTFEDLHHQPEKTYLDLLEKLRLQEYMVKPIDDSSLKQSIALSSFEKRTSGKLRRGDQGKVFVSGCRKGVTGDWKNHFTPLLKKRFKEIAGGALIRLGYEKDDSW